LVFDVLILGWDSLAVFVCHTHPGIREYVALRDHRPTNSPTRGVHVIFRHAKKHHPKFHAEERGPALTAEVLKSMKEQQMEVNIFHVGAVIGACRSLAEAGSMDWVNAWQKRQAEMGCTGCASGQDWQLALSFLRGAMDDSLEAGKFFRLQCVMKSRLE
jgi:hypothetical protein